MGNHSQNPKVPGNGTPRALLKLTLLFSPPIFSFPPSHPKTNPQNPTPFPIFPTKPIPQPPPSFPPRRCCRPGCRCPPCSRDPKRSPIRSYSVNSRLPTKRPPARPSRWVETDGCAGACVWVDSKKKYRSPSQIPGRFQKKCFFLK